MPNATAQSASFKAAAEKFANDLQKSFASSMPAQPEDQLKGPVQALIKAARHSVITKTEAQVQDLGGRPDIGIEVAGALCGHVELKAPGFGAQTKKFKGRDLAQWKKYAALPNILYTDAQEWALYRSGVHMPEKRPLVIRLDEVIERGAAALNDALIGQLLELLTDFLMWQPVVPTGSKALAALLAPLCRLLREDVALAVADDKSALKRLSAEMRAYLFPLSSDEDFADTYAQTLAYALLLARLNGETQLTAASAAARKRTALTFDRATELPSIAMAKQDSEAVTPMRYGWRTLDRHWCLSDGRLCDRLRAGLWATQSDSQVFMSSLLSGVLGVGPAASASAYVPALHHFRGSFGGRDVIPLWRDVQASQPNLPARLLAELGSQLDAGVSAEDFLAYTYAVLSAPDYVSTFSEELTVPGPRLPITTDAALFRQAVAYGRQLLWVLEATLAMQSGLNQLLAAILAGQTVAAGQLSQPTANELCAPGDEDDAAQASLI